MTDETKPDPWFIYSPEGVEPKRWRYAPGRLLSVEAEEIERRTGMPFGVWMQSVPLGSILALRAFVYIMLRRETPDLSWDSVQICMDEVDFEEAAPDEPDADPKATAPESPGTGPLS